MQGSRALAGAISHLRATGGGGELRRLALGRLETSAEFAAAFDRVVGSRRRSWFRIHRYELLSIILDAFELAPLIIIEKEEAAKAAREAAGLVEAAERLIVHYEALVAGTRAILRTSETGRDVGGRVLERLSILADVRADVAAWGARQWSDFRPTNKRNYDNAVVGAFQYVLIGYLAQAGLGPEYEFVRIVSACLYPSKRPIDPESIRKSQQRARKRVRMGAREATAG